MKMKEAIDIGRSMNCITIADVDYLIGRLHYRYSLIDEVSFAEYCDDFDMWCELYEQEFPKRFFVDLKI